MSLTVVMPSITGREDELRKTVKAFEKKTPSVAYEWVFEFDHPNVGAAWNAGAAKATGEYLLLGNDDLEPETDEWFPAAKLTLDKGYVPIGWIREDELGVFGRDFTRLPMCKREWWTPLPEIHYYSDNAFGEFQRRKGHIPMVAFGFDFYHRRSMVGRDESAERVMRDRKAYLAAL